MGHPPRTTHGPLALLLTLALALPGSAAAALQDGPTDAVLLQGFHWESHEASPWWRVIEAEAPRIGDAGFDLVWLPPSSRSANASLEGYLPNELYTQSGFYGDEAALRGAIEALHAEGVMAIADIVINHRVGTYDWGDFSNPTWGADAVCGDDEWALAAGAPDTGSPYHAARDIDHTKGYVRESIRQWLGWMRSDIGYDGFRYDYVKGYGGRYVGEYNGATDPAFSVGEYWDDLDLSNPDAHRQRQIDWVDQTGSRSAVFDFTTKGILQAALTEGSYWRLRDGAGRPPGVIGWWPQKAVTFIDNHDTGPSPGGGQNHWPFPADRVLAGYAYILTHPGIPTVYWPHFFDWGLEGDLRALMALRTDQGLTSESAVEILRADGQSYGAIIDGRVALRLGGGDWTPGPGFASALSGPGFEVWALQEATPTPSPGEEGALATVIYVYRETVPGQDIFIRGGHDASLVAAGYYLGMDEPIAYRNTLNGATAGTKSDDDALDWFSDSALDWTTDVWPSAWGPAPSYAAQGYGVDPENTQGPHWWKFDVEMTGSEGEWFEFKAFLRQGGQAYWEGDIAQPGAPYSSHNHWARKGYVTWVRFGEDGAQMSALSH